jgi:branched chain amino acid efflux pump
MPEFIAYAVVGIGTYFMRSGFILARSDSVMPPVVAQGLRFVGPAVLSALVAVFVADGGGLATFVSLRPETLGMVAAIGVAWWKRDVILTVTVGIAAVWILQTFMA